MKRKSDGPKCPNPRRLYDLIEFVGEELEQYAPSDKDRKDKIRDIIDCLEWTAVMLDNRKNYHKKRTLKQKYVWQLAEERGLLDEAEELSDQELHKIISNQPPDPDEVEILGEKDEA